MPVTSTSTSTSILLLLLTTFLSTTALSPPPCQSVAPAQDILNITTATLSGLSSPFDITYASSTVAFVATNDSIAVLNTTSFIPSLIRSIPITNISYIPSFGGPLGLALTSDKKTLFAAAGPGFVAIDVAAAISGRSDAVLGSFAGSYGEHTAIQVLVAPGDEYVFVSIEDGNTPPGFYGGIEVFRVQRGVENGLTTVQATYIGAQPLYAEVVGMAVSADERLLYVTSEGMNQTTIEGVLSVLDIATLEREPGTAVLGSVDAGCAPVRVVVSPWDGSVWVTARESNMVLVFDWALLVSPNTTGKDALVANIQVGTAPVDLVFVNEGLHLLTADSDRFAAETSQPTVTGITVVSIVEVLNGKRSGFPRIQTGLFPREFAVDPDGKTALVSDYDSNQVQALDVGQLNFI